MKKVRLFGLITFLLGIAGIFLSVSADHIGLSLFGGKNGWGVVNTAGSLGGCVMILVGLILWLRTVADRREQTDSECLTVIGYDTPLQASTIPTIVSLEKRAVYLEPRRTVIKIDENKL